MSWISGMYGADAKAESGREDDWLAVKGGAKSAFYDTTASDAVKAEQQKQMAAVAGRAAPQVEKTSFGPGAYATAAKVGPLATMAAPVLDRRDLAPRADQMKALGGMQGMMAGTGPSLAGLQMQSSVDAALANANASQGAAPRSMGTLSAFNAGNAAGAGMSAAGMQSAQTKNKEAEAAAQNFGALSGSIRGSDLAMANAQATHNTNASLANAKWGNDAAMANASFAQQMAGANATMRGHEAEMQQSQEIANIEAMLRGRGMNDAAVNNFLASYQAQFNADNASKRAYHEFAQAGQQNYDAGEYARTRALEADRDAKINAGIQVMTMGMSSGTKK